MTAFSEFRRNDVESCSPPLASVERTPSISLLPRSRLQAAKVAFTARHVATPAMVSLLEGNISPRPGDLVLARIKRIGQHFTLHLPSGRKARLHCGDEIVACYGNRYAVDQFEGVVPETLSECNLLASGGVVGTAKSRHLTMGTPTVVEPVGLVGDAHGHTVNIRDFGLGIRVPRKDATPLVLAVVGTEMNAGKTTTAVQLIKGLRASGLRVAAAKITGTGSSGDYWEMVDAGAAPVLDFTDVGYVSTFQLEPKQVEEIFVSLISHLSESGPEVIVVEIADGLMQRETEALLTGPVFPRYVSSVVFAASDAMGAVGGVSWLRQHHLPIAAVSGRVTQSELGCEAVRKATRLRVYSKSDLSAPETAIQLLPMYERAAATA